MNTEDRGALLARAHVIISANRSAGAPATVDARVALLALDALRALEAAESRIKAALLALADGRVDVCARVDEARKALEGAAE